MLKNLYFLIIIIPLVQITMCSNLISVPMMAKYQGNGKLAAQRDSVLDSRDPRCFGSILEHRNRKPAAAKKVAAMASPQWTTVVSKTEDKSYDEIKTLLVKVLEQIEEIERKTDKEQGHVIKDNLDPVSLHGIMKDDIKKKRKDNDQKTKWGHWTDWSSCSVSCGKGRQIRWRHCIENCSDAETEMEEKICQLPACGPGKLFGVLKL